ncbi:DeoR/GlpR family DNA-binding transcription regulator [Acidisoma sp.]|uniref:DeoR/GlpR family DNA-binding transcription regulator n=1 Tax=Acidisoma sp. TaxID=1872115 RepID=UPI003B004BB7
MRHSRSRREAIVAECAQGSVDVDRLAARFGVTASTIRRDLQTLSAQHAITRTYGGAVLTTGHVSEAEESLQARRDLHRDAKAAIAALARSLLHDGERLILDGGSTVEAFGRGLHGRRHQVITNNLPLLPILAAEPGIEVLVLGGSLRAISMTTNGPLAEQGLRQIAADRCFLSADGVVAGRGLCEATLEQVALKSMMMTQAAEVFVLADASKLGRTSQPFWALLDRPLTLITDAHASAEQCRPFEDQGVQVMRAPGPP